MQTSSMKDFEIIKKLGDGSFSQVYQVLRHSDSQTYALKKVKLGLLKSREKENAINEVRILASISHPNIVPYKEAFYDESSNSLCIIMEYVSGGTLSHLIESMRKSGNKLSESVIWSYVTHLLKGIKALHDLDILHRDLKSANIFLTKDQKSLKIADMNVSKVAKGGFLYTQTGTPYYASPEIWRDEPYNAKSDIWSLGCVLYELCALSPPFTSNGMKDLYLKIQKAHFARIPLHYSDQLQDFIQRCLTKQASKRPKCEEMLKFVNNMKKNCERAEEMNSKNHGNGDIVNVLLKTIKFPKNPRSLVDILPKANYQEKDKKNVSMDHAVSVITNRETMEGILPMIEIKNRRKITRRVGKLGSGRENKENKENERPTYSVKHVKMPKIDTRSKSPLIFKI